MGLFGNAFACPDSEKVSEEVLEEEDALFERLADKVVARGLTSPAILFLEMHRPLGFIAGQLLHSLGPFAELVVSQHDVDVLARSLCRRDGISRLVGAIERRDKETEDTSINGEGEV